MARTGIYNIDTDKLGEFLLPTRLRGEKMLAYIRSVMAGFDYFLTERIDKERNAVLQSIEVNAQKILFENWLNTRFRSIGKQIYIDNIDSNSESVIMHNEIEGYGQVSLFNEAEGVPTYFFNQNELQSEAGFCVNYPNYLETTNELDTLIFHIDRIKVAGTSYVMKGYGSYVDPRPPVETDDFDAIMEAELEAELL